MMDWIGSKVLYIKMFTAIFVRPIIYRYSILYRIFKHEYFYCQGHVSIHSLICDVVRQVHQDRSHFQSRRNSLPTKFSVHRLSQLLFSFGKTRPNNIPFCRLLLVGCLPCLQVRHNPNSRQNSDWCQVAAIGIQSRVHRNSAMGDPGWTGGNK